MRRIADGLQAAAASGASENEGAAAELAAGVGAMANVSKGFKPAGASEVEAWFFQVGCCWVYGGALPCCKKYENFLLLILHEP